MTFLFSIILLSLTSCSWCYVPERVLGGELQVKRFTHPPGDQDFAWLIGGYSDNPPGLNRLDSHSNAGAQTQLPQTSSFHQPLTSSSESLEQVLNDYPRDLISQANQLNGKPQLDSGNQREVDPHSGHSCIHPPLPGRWAERFHCPSDSNIIVQSELSQFKPHSHFVPNYQILNGQPGSFWTPSLLQGQVIEGANLPRPYLTSSRRNENLVNEDLANNHLIKPRDIPNVFENDIASSTFLPRISAIDFTKSSNIESDLIQGFENSNLGELVDNEKSTVGLSGASHFHENHLSHKNHNPEEFKEKAISSHPSPQSDLNIELFLNDLIHYPPHQAKENENDKLGFFENHALAPQGVAAQNFHNKNSDFTIGKALESGSGFYSSVSNSPWSETQQIRYSTPNVELYNSKLNLYSDNDNLAHSRGENYLNRGKSMSSQEKYYDENNIIIKDREKRKNLESSLRIENLKDFTKQSESYRIHIEGNLEPVNSDFNSQSLMIIPPNNLSPRYNKKLKNIIDPISKGINEYKTDTMVEGERLRKNSKNLVEKLNENGGNTIGTKKSKERVRYHQGVDSKLARLGFFGKYQPWQKALQPA
ncbi:expressed protein [Phakopsora pachyrhizi]|uniref:Expressed protein n=1 Tax=Phakopsora pachyrhizi TaxID=170000 RepID=A0AAV0BM44_PHAPC|nr:expressed protein [Phakopsora pachyrhizi]